MAKKYYNFNKPQQPKSVFDNTNMGEFTKFATATAGLSPLSDDYTPLFKDVASGKSPFQDFLNKPFGFSSGNAMQSENAQNVAQESKSGSNSLMDLHSSLLDLLGGKQDLDMSSYNRVERDIRGNIIGLSGKVQVDPLTGISGGKLA